MQLAGSQNDDHQSYTACTVCGQASVCSAPSPSQLSSSARVPWVSFVVPADPRSILLIWFRSPSARRLFGLCSSLTTCLFLPVLMNSSPCLEPNAKEIPDADKTSPTNTNARHRFSFTPSAPQRGPCPTTRAVPAAAPSACRRRGHTWTSTLGYIPLASCAAGPGTARQQR